MQHLSFFIAYLHEIGNCASTIRSYLSAIAYYNKCSNRTDFTKAAPILQAMKGLDAVSKTKTKRLPITLPLLERMLSALHSLQLSPYDLILYQALFAVMYFCGLRASEVARTVSDQHIIRAKNVVRDADCYILTLTSFKFSAEPVTFKLFPKTSVNPVSLLYQYDQVRNKLSSFYFCRPDGQSLLRQNLVDILKRVMILLNLDPDLYNCHSFRIGFATDMFYQNYSATSIKLRGRWSSDAYLSYLKPSSIEL